MGGGGILQHSLLRYVQLSHYQSCCLNQGEFLKLIFYIKEWIVPISAKPCSSFSSSFWCRYDPQQRYGCPRVHFDLNGILTQPPIMASWPHSPEMVQECFVVTWTENGKVATHTHSSPKYRSQICTRRTLSCVRYGCYASQLAPQSNILSGCLLVTTSS